MTSKKRARKEKRLPQADVDRHMGPIYEFLQTQIPNAEHRVQLEIYCCARVQHPENWPEYARQPVFNGNAEVMCWYMNYLEEKVFPRSGPANQPLCWTFEPGSDGSASGRAVGRRVAV